MLVVTDIDKSVEFYKKVLGLRVIMDFGANKTLTGGFADVKQRLKNMGCSSPHTKERYPVIQGPLLLLFCCILLPDQPGNLIGEAIDDLHPHAAVYIHAVDKEQEHFIGQLVRSKRPAGHAAGLRQFTVLAL